MYGKQKIYRAGCAPGKYSVAVRDGVGKLVMECIIETKASTVLEFIRGLLGELWIGFEEGTSAAWLYDLPHP
jgi:hypothetical protein